MRDRFLIFSGGKAELRKGQDIVMAASRSLRAATGGDAGHRVHSPWPAACVQPGPDRDRGAVVFDQSGKLDAGAWAGANGIAPEQVIDLGNVPNASMPPILREMDAAVFTNRAEGGTNLVAMECMACGIPVILSRNTGHLDLIEKDNCYRSTTRGWPGTAGPASGRPVLGESQVEEVVECLEQIFADRAAAQQRGMRPAS